MGFLLLMEWQDGYRERIVGGAVMLGCATTNLERNCVMVPKGNEGLEVFVLDVINLRVKDGDNKEATQREPPPLSGEIPSKLVVLSSPGKSH